jgi:predicted O-methyltransferase YrrM
MTQGSSSVPAVQRLLATLASTRRAGRIAEVGTAFGDGARAIAGVLGPGVTFVTVESDPARAAAARPALAGLPVELVVGRWQDVLPARDPFDLLFFDAPADAAALVQAIELLAPGGMLIKDDLTPGLPVDGDPVRQILLRDPRLVATEIQVSTEMAVILATRRTPA